MRMNQSHTTNASPTPENNSDLSPHSFICHSNRGELLTDRAQLIHDVKRTFNSRKMKLPDTRNTQFEAFKKQVHSQKMLKVKQKVLDLCQMLKDVEVKRKRNMDIVNGELKIELICEEVRMKENQDKIKKVLEELKECFGQLRVCLECLLKQVLSQARAAEYS